MVNNEVISSMRNNVDAGRINEFGLFGAYQVEHIKLRDEWEIMTESEVKARSLRALNSSRAVQNYPLSHGQPSLTSDEISKKMKIL